MAAHLQWWADSPTRTKSSITHTINSSLIIPKSLLSILCHPLATTHLMWAVAPLHVHESTTQHQCVTCSPGHHQALKNPHAYTRQTLNQLGIHPRPLGNHSMLHHQTNGSLCWLTIMTCANCVGSVCTRRVRNANSRNKPCHIRQRRPNRAWQVHLPHWLKKNHA